MKMTITPFERLTAAADAVIAQAMENPELGIPADPDVAEFMGCFEEQAVSPDDFIIIDDDADADDDDDGEPKHG